MYKRQHKYRQNNLESSPESEIYRKKNEAYLYNSKPRIRDNELNPEEKGYHKAESIFRNLENTGHHDYTLIRKVSNMTPKVRIKFKLNYIEKKLSK